MAQKTPDLHTIGSPATLPKAKILVVKLPDNVNIMTAVVEESGDDQEQHSILIRKKIPILKLPMLRKKPQPTCIGRLCACTGGVALLLFALIIPTLLVITYRERDTIFNPKVDFNSKFDNVIRDLDAARKGMQKYVDIVVTSEVRTFFSDATSRVWAGTKEFGIKVSNNMQDFWEILFQPLPDYIKKPDILIRKGNYEYGPRESNTRKTRKVQAKSPVFREERKNAAPTQERNALNTTTTLLRPPEVVTGGEVPTLPYIHVRSINRWDMRFPWSYRQMKALLRLTETATLGCGSDLWKNTSLKNARQIGPERVKIEWNQMMNLTLLPKVINVVLETWQ